MPTLFEGTVTITVTMKVTSQQPDTTTATADMQAQGNLVASTILGLPDVVLGSTATAVVTGVASNQFYPT
jgi:hypothetical protein